MSPVDQAISSRAVLAVTSGAPRDTLYAELARALYVGGQAALDAAADAAARARTAFVPTSSRGGQ